MNFAIIAAGEGSRLRKEGFDKPKPMVRLEGEMLVERLIRIFKDNGAESINIIINAQSPQLEAFLIDLKAREPLLNLIIKSTPSSAHSFYSILENIGFENKDFALQRLIRYSMRKFSKSTSPLSLRTKRLTLLWQRPLTWTMRNLFG